MASARLRTAFKYPTEDSDDSESELDEEHQDRLITSIQAEDAQKTTLYRTLFLLVPLTGALFFIYTFLFNAKTAQHRLLALMSLSSLASTAWILHFMPVQAPDRKGKRPVYQVDAAKGPVERYLVYLNAALAGLLVLVASVSWRRGANEEAWREALPGIVFGLTMFVRGLLAPVDLEELQRAKYDYKGA